MQRAKLKNNTTPAAKAPKGRSYKMSFLSLFQAKTPLRFALLSLALLVVLEVFVFNFNSFRLIGQESVTLDLSTASHTNFKSQGHGTLLLEGAGTPPRGSLEFINIGRHVKSLTLHFTQHNAPTFGVDLGFTDATSSETRRNVTFDLIANNKKTHTVMLQTSGDTQTLRLHFILPKEDSSLILTGISINQAPPFRFSLLRLLILYTLVMGLWFLLRSKSLQKPFAQNSKNMTRISIGTTAVIMLLTLILSFQSLLPANFKRITGNQITQELVDAFEAGQVHLLQEPTEELLRMENPYDWGRRDAERVTYLWDHCLYNGKYYSYYGIAPVLLLFLPYHLATGYYFASDLAVLLFSLAGMACLMLLYLAVIRRYFSKLPGSLVLMGLLTLQLASGIFISIARPLFYEIAISSGFAAVLAGAYFLISSNIVSDGRLSLPRLTLSSVFLGLAVLCRPTLAVYCVAALVFLWYGLQKCRDGKKLVKKTTIKYLLAALLPYAVLGSVQVAYNYLRFGNPLDFGIQYSLTINDFTRSQFSISFVFVLLFAYLFNAPAFVPSFPFFTSTFQTFNLNGYMFIDDKPVEGISIGLFFRALPMFSYLLAPRLLRQKLLSRRAAVLLGVTSLVAPLIIICSAWESGYSARYNADISWPMLLGTLFLLFTFYESLKSKDLKRLVVCAMAAATVLCLSVNLAQLIHFVNRYSSLEEQAMLTSFGRLFEFWR